MECPNCKVKLEDNSRYCPRCGLLFKDLFLENIIKKKGFESDLCNLYFPNGKISFNIMRISIKYMFGSFFYAAIKKMYKEAIVSMISLLIFLFLLDKGEMYIFNSYGFYFTIVVLLFALSIFVYLYYLFKFNDFYILNVKQRVNRILRENVDSSDEKIIELCRKDSKNNYLVGFILLIIFLFLTIL